MKLSLRAPSALPILAALVLGAGCDASSGGGDVASQNGAVSTASFHDAQALDVNDVSILFGNDAHGQPFPSMALDEALWPQAVFDQVTGFTTKAGGRLHTEATVRSNWRVMGVRFDPCVRPPDGRGGVLPPTAGIHGLKAGVNGSGEACSSMQIRFSVQPMMGADVIDTAAHLVFDIDGAEAPEPFVQRLLDIKKASRVATTGKPLGVHPGLANGAADATLSRLIGDFVKTTVAKATLSKVTFMGLDTPNAGRPDGAPWTFFAGLVANGTWTPAAPGAFDVTHGKSVAFDAPSITFTGAAGNGILVGTEPLDAALARLGLTTSDVATTQPLVTAGDPDDPNGPAGPAATAPQLARVHFIDNPEKNNAFLSDCTSCHTTSPIAHRLQIADDPSRFQIPKGITGYASVAARQDGPDNYVVRSFGYMPSIAVADGGDGKNHAVVSNRVATESALVVDILNRQILGVANGGKDCSASAVWTCFATAESSDRECLAKCR